MEKIEAGGHDYAYTIHQRKRDRPFLLMLHGFMGDQRVFDHLTGKLSAFCNPITLDLLGHGASFRPTDPSCYTAARQVSELIKVLKQLNPFPLFLHGYSMGGRLALQTAVTDPNLFEGIILESTTCGLQDADKRQQRRQVDRQRAHKIVTDFNGFLDHWSTLSLFDSPSVADEHLTKRYRMVQRQQSRQALAASLAGFGTGIMPPVCSELGIVSVPVMVMAGASDQKYQELSPALAARFPAGNYTAVEAGHRIHLDNPEEWIKNVQDMICGEYTSIKPTNS